MLNDNFAKAEQHHFLSVNEAAAFLGFSKLYLYQLVHRKEVPHYKPNGGRILFDISELDAWVRGGKVLSRDELAQRAESVLNSRGR